VPAAPNQGVVPAAHIAPIPASPTR
jgi:hypothetical protein